MKKYIIKTYQYGRSRPYVALFVTTALISGGWYFANREDGAAANLSVIGEVSRGTVIKSVSGTGKIQAAKEWDLKPKVGGDVTAVLVRSGEKVKKGDVLIRLNASDAHKAARDARIAYESAQVSAGKQSVQDSALKLSVTPEQTLSSAMVRMTQFYSAYALIDKNLESLLHDRTADPGSSPVHNIVYYASYDDAFKTYPADMETLYKQTKAEYSAGLRAFEVAKNGSQSDQKKALVASEKLTQTASALAKKGMDLLRAFEYRLAQNDSTHSAQALVASQRATTQSDINTLSTAYKDFLDIDAALLDYQKSLDESPYNAESSKLSVRERANALTDAVDKISDYIIVAPADGMIASVPVKVGDTIGSGVVAVSVVTEEMEANLSLSEVDAAAVQVGENATLTFDAFPELSLTGKVVEKDLLGTVSSNVVSYTVKIAPDTTDTRLLPNMSVSAEIIITAKPDVLIVPSGAVKSNAEKVVMVPDPADPALLSSSTSKGIALTLAPISRVVQVGLVGNANTEIVSGLNEGDRIIVRTNKSSSAPTQQRSIFQAAGGGGGTGGGRALGGGR